MTEQAPDRGALLAVEDLVVEIQTAYGLQTVLDGVSFTVSRGEALGLVGESGSGKSMTLRAIMGLLPANARIASGRILLNNEELTKLPPRQLNKRRGAGIAMVFQEPMTALNPVMRIGPQVIDGAARHHSWTRRERRRRAVELMARMGIPDANLRYDAYPHELSGGMRQRVMIAAALAADPAVVLCDEPTTALDVTIQDQITSLLAELLEQRGTGLLYVTHDLAVVAQLCDRVEVMYSGNIVESGSVREVFDAPRHPYTLGLVRATPTMDGPRTRLESIPGSAPGLDERPNGCAFAPRCEFADDRCTRERIELRVLTPTRTTRCIRPEMCIPATEGSRV